MLLMVSCGCVPPKVDTSSQPTTVSVSAKALFCAYGGVGMIPNPIPPGYELHFVEAIVEIESLREISNVAVSDFVLVDAQGKATKIKRVLGVEVFNRPHVDTEGIFAYYLNDGGTQTWNGTLPAGRIRLRVDASLVEAPDQPVRFRLTIGPHVIEGRIDGEWPT